MRRSLVVIPSAILLLALALVAVGWISLHHNINPAAMKTIKPGMTQAEVESILGGPPGLYYRWQTTRMLPIWGQPGEKRWIADDLAVVVWFDDSARVRRVEIADVRHGPQRGFFLSGENWAPKFVQDWLRGDEFEINEWSYSID